MHDEWFTWVFLGISFTGVILAITTLCVVAYKDRKKL